MDKKIKLIWDFFGEDALKTAEHHATHLKEFATKESIQLFDYGTEEHNKSAVAYMVVEEKNMITVRDALKPKRGQWVEQ